MSEATATGPAGTDLVSPQTLRGFQDLLPEAAITRDRLVRKIQAVYERFGYLPLDTPVLEHLATLVGVGGDEANKNMFRLQSPEREPIAMRFDLTVPFARLIAQYPNDLKLPFRRYAIGPVFRADEPRPGRFRQFTQFDIDAAGSDSVAVDAEIIATMVEAMKAIGLVNSAAAQEYQIKINNRKLVDALMAGCGITDDLTVKNVLRVVDKLDKVGIGNVVKELGPGRVDDSGDPIKGLALPKETIDTVVDFIGIKEPTRAATVAALTKKLPANDASAAALAEMTALAAALDALGVAETDAVFDSSLARGLDYYTGPVFEGVLTAGGVGSVMGGGRYDNLVGRFLNEKIPATGVSIGVDRLIAGLTLAGKLKPTPTTVQALVIAMTGVPQPELLKVATELRTAGIATVIYFGKPKTGVTAQFRYANDTKIPVAVVLGENEIKDGTVSLKDLWADEKTKLITDKVAYKAATAQNQRVIPRSELVAGVKASLARMATELG